MNRRYRAGKPACTERISAFTMLNFRRFTPAMAGALFLFGSFATLAGCDIVSKDDISGIWEGTAVFTVDTLIAEQNIRMIAEYESTFTFDITDDSGLISGTVTGSFDGFRTVIEAGGASQMLDYVPTDTFSDGLEGTFIDPILEMDVPGGPYEDDLWTFDVTGNTGDLDRLLTHRHTFTLSDSTEYTVAINSEDLFEIKYQN